MSSCSSRTLYVGNLPEDIREREVEDLFCKVPFVISTDDTCRCTGFTLNGVNLSGRPIILSRPCDSRAFTRTSRKGLIRTPTYYPPRQVSVWGFHSFLGKKKIVILLAEHFRYCGEISHIYVKTDSAKRVSGSASLKFSSDEGYRKALELNGTEFEEGYLVVSKSKCMSDPSRPYARGSSGEILGSWDRRRGTFNMTAVGKENAEMPKTCLENLKHELAGKVEESADDTCRCTGLTLNGVNLSGRPIILRRPCDNSAFMRSISKEEVMRSPTYYPRVVFVYGFQRYLATKEKIEILLAEHFRYCGEILHIHVAETRHEMGLAYLKFSSDEGYKKALELNGNGKLEVLKFRCMRDPQPSFCVVRNGVSFGRNDEARIGDRRRGTYLMTAVGKGKKIMFED